MLAMMNELMRTTRLLLSELCCCDYQFVMHRLCGCGIESSVESHNVGTGLSATKDNPSDRALSISWF